MNAPMKTLKIFLVSLALLSPLSSINPAHSTERTIKQMLEECFMGLLVSNEDDRVLAIGLNLVTGALGSIPVTSGYLSEGSFCASKRVASLAFITESYALLLDETVKGSGPHLRVALNMAGCASESHEATIKTLRQHMPAILESAPTDYASVEGVSSYFKGLQSAASQNCTV